MMKQRCGGVITSTKTRPAADFEGPVAAAAADLAKFVERGFVERQIALGTITVEQQLPAGREVGGERHRAVLARGGDDGIEDAALHSTRSTKIWILPPQARPTSQA